jgi:hypothetical protein
MDHQPIFAFFFHPDRSWYRIWITKTEPKSEQGHPWHLHANFDKSGTISPVAGTRWFEQPYGMRNWDFRSREEAINAFIARAMERTSHGYELREGEIPPEPEQAPTASARE